MKLGGIGNIWGVLAGGVELVYAYVGVENAELKKTIDGLVTNGCKFEPSVMKILHQRYFRAPRDDDALAEPTRARLFRLLQELRRPTTTEELAAAVAGGDVAARPPGRGPGLLRSGQLSIISFARAVVSR